MVFPIFVGTACRDLTPGEADPSRVCWLRVPRAWIHRGTGQEGGAVAALLSRVLDARRGSLGPTRGGERENGTFVRALTSAPAVADPQVYVAVEADHPPHSGLVCYVLFRSCNLRFHVACTHPSRIFPPLSLHPGEDVCVFFFFFSIVFTLFSCRCCWCRAPQHRETRNSFCPDILLPRSHKSICSFGWLSSRRFRTVWLTWDEPRSDPIQFDPI